MFANYVKQIYRARTIIDKGIKVERLPVRCLIKWFQGWRRSATIACDWKERKRKCDVSRPMTNTVITMTVVCATIKHDSSSDVDNFWSFRRNGIKKNYTMLMMLITNQGKDTIKLKELFRYRSLTFTLPLFGEIPITRGERSFTSKYTIHLELIRTGVWMFRKKMRLQLCFFFGL